MKIFNRYLDKLWSIAFSSVGLIALNNYPFRDFLYKSLLYRDSLNLGTYQIPSVIGKESLSLFCFLTLFYASIRYFKCPSRRLSIITALWALYFKISLFNALFGIFFWFSYFPIRIIRQKHLQNKKEVLKEIIFQFFVASTILFLCFTGENVFLAQSYNHTFNPDLYYYCAYFLIPILLMLGTYYLHKVDYYEIFIKFWHIYIMMIIEIVIAVLYKIYKIKTGFDPVGGNITLFFLHFYYYVPPIYYLCRPYKEFNTGIEGCTQINILRKIVYYIFKKYSFVYLYLVIAGIILFAGVSIHNNYNIKEEIQLDKEVTIDYKI